MQVRSEDARDYYSNGPEAPPPLRPILHPQVDEPPLVPVPHPDAQRIQDRYRQLFPESQPVRPNVLQGLRSKRYDAYMQ